MTDPLTVQGKRRYSQSNQEAKGVQKSLVLSAMVEVTMSANYQERGTSIGCRPSYTFQANAVSFCTSTICGLPLNIQRRKRIPRVIDDGIWIHPYLSDNLTYTHPSHNENEHYPRHHRSFDTENHQISSNCIQKENPQSIP